MDSLDWDFATLQLQAWNGQDWTAVWSLSGGRGSSWHQGAAHFPSTSTALRFQGSLRVWSTGDLAVRAFRTAVSLEELACEDFQVSSFWLEPGTVGPSRAVWRVVDIGLEARGAESQTAVLDSAQISIVDSEVMFFLSFQVVGPTAALEVQQLTENGWTHLQTKAIASFGSWQNLTGPISVQTQSLRLLATMNSTTDLVKIRSFQLGVAQFAHSLEDAGCDFEEGFCKWTEGGWLLSAGFRPFVFASQAWSIGTAAEVPCEFTRNVPPFLAVLASHSCPCAGALDKPAFPKCRRCLPGLCLTDGRVGILQSAGGDVELWPLAGELVRGRSASGGLAASQATPASNS